MTTDDHSSETPTATQPSYTRVRPVNEFSERVTRPLSRRSLMTCPRSAEDTNCHRLLLTTRFPRNLDVVGKHEPTLGVLEAVLAFPSPANSYPML